MRCILITLCAILLCLPARADTDGRQILNNLFRAGLQAVQTTLQQEQKNAAPSEDEAYANPTDTFNRVLVDSLEKSIGDIKEQYKEEGRAYARELADMLAERIVHSPRIQSTITTIQALCWAIIAYLVLVSLVLLVSMQRLRINSRHILEQLNELKQKHNGNS